MTKGKQLTMLLLLTTALSVPGTAWAQDTTSPSDEQTAQDDDQQPDPPGHPDLQGAPQGDEGRAEPRHRGGVASRQGR